MGALVSAVGLVVLPQGRGRMMLGRCCWCMLLYAVVGLMCHLRKSASFCLDEACLVTNPCKWAAYHTRVVFACMALWSVRWQEASRRVRIVVDSSHGAAAHDSIAQSLPKIFLCCTRGSGRPAPPVACAIGACGRVVRRQEGKEVKKEARREREGVGHLSVFVYASRTVPYR